MDFKEDLNDPKNIIENIHCVLITHFFHFAPHFGSNAIEVTCPQKEKKDYYHCYTEFFSWFLTRENNQLRL